MTVAYEDYSWLWIYMKSMKIFKEYSYLDNDLKNWQIST